MVVFIPPLCVKTTVFCPTILSSLNIHNKNHRFVPPHFKSGGTFCPYFHILTALFATTLFSYRFERRRFLPSLCHFGGAFCHHFCILTALSAPTFLECILVKLHYHICKNNLFSHHSCLCP